MAFEPKDTSILPPHHIVMEERASLSISGVEEVESFDENTISSPPVRGR